MRKLRIKLAFLIAGKELHEWRSKHNRIVAKMSEGATIHRIIKLIEEFEDYEPCYKCGGFSFGEKLIALIKGETK